MVSAAHALVSSPTPSRPLWVIGVAVTTLDGVFLGWLRLRYGRVWAAVLAHGFSNTIGLVTFFLVGPVYGLR